MTPRDRIIWAVLESALDADIPHIVAACRRLIEASRRSWVRYADPEDKALVFDAYCNVIADREQP